MRGVDEETLLAVRASLAAEGLNTDVIDALISLKIRELNPWMTLEEFLKSGFGGWCWIKYATDIHITYFANSAFQLSDIETRSIFSLQYITRVQPIHKPEPPI